MIDEDERLIMSYDIILGILIALLILQVITLGLDPALIKLQLIEFLATAILIFLYLKRNWK
jgi:hypothetical protein